MAGPLPKIGKVVLSVDIPAESRTRGQVDDRLAAKLFQMVESRRLAATWVPQDPLNFSLLERLADAPARHDLAIVGDSSWIGAAAGRTR